MPPERLQKVLASAGIASRRDCEEYISAGRVAVNGKVVHLPGMRVDPESDQITVDGRPIGQIQPRTYVMLHKPAGVVSTTDDPQGRPTVVGMVDLPARLFPIGRLDYDSEGLLLLTDDGELTQRLTHPSNQIEKEYRVLLNSPPTPDALREWRNGVSLDGVMTAPAWVDLIERTDEGAWVRVVLREGRKRQIREVARLLGYEVLRLIRVREGPLLLGDLEVGAWRVLSDAEVEQLWEHADAAAQPDSRRRRDAAAPDQGRGARAPLRPPRRSDEPRARDDDRPRDDRPPRRFDDRPRDDRYGDRPPRRFDDRPRDDRGSSRYSDRPRDDRGPSRYSDRPRDDRYSDRPPRRFDDRPREDRPPRRFDDRPRDDRGSNRYSDRPRDDRYSDRPPRRYSDRPRDDRSRRFDDRGPNRYSDRPRDDRGSSRYSDRPRDDRGSNRYSDRPPRRFDDRPRDDRQPRRFDDRPRQDDQTSDRPEPGNERFASDRRGQPSQRQDTRRGDAPRGPQRLGGRVGMTRRPAFPFRPRPRPARDEEDEA